MNTTSITDDPPVRIEKTLAVATGALSSHIGPPRNRILEGNCIDVLAVLPENSIDLIFADPPYNLQLRQELWRPNMTRVDAVDDDWDRFASFEAYDTFTEAWLKACRRVLKETGTIWVIGSYHNIHRIGKILMDLGFWILNEVVWEKCLASTVNLYARTPRGERPISVKDIVRCDPATVQLWNGERWTQVLGWEKTQTPHGGVLIELRSGERIGCTDNHRWPTRRGLLRASELQVGDRLTSCQLPPNVNARTPEGLDDELIGWFVGLYLAEGSRTQDTIQIASHVKEATRFERMARLAEAFHGSLAIHNTTGNTCTANLNGPVFNALVDTYIGGRTAKTKHLTWRCWERSNRFLRAVLDGYLSGDGSYEAATGRWRLGFAYNSDLERDLRAMCSRLGVPLRLRAARSKFKDQEFPAHRGEIRFHRSGHYNEKDDHEIVRLDRCWGEVFWEIIVADEPHLFALASGVLTHNSNPMPNFRGVRFTNAHETLLWAQKRQGARYTFNYHAMKAMNEGTQMRSVWRLPVCGGKERIRNGGEKAHSTQKPEALLHRIVLACSNPGDVVLDPFFGSGTTGAVAQHLRRDWIGIEQDSCYIQIAENRIREAGAPLTDEEIQALTGKEKPARVAFKRLLELGMLRPGDSLYLDKTGHEAVVMTDGTIRSGEHNGSIHSVARALLGAPCNGWTHWQCVTPQSSERIPIDRLREEARRRMALDVAGIADE